MLGQDLFDKAVAGDTIFKSQTEFRNYFKGLQIRGGSDNKAILGVQSNQARMVLYYNERNEDGEVDSLRLNFPYERGRKFNNISTDWTGTSLEGLTEPYADFFPPDSNRYIQEGAGLVVKLDLGAALEPLLDTLDTDLVLVNRADLRIGVEGFSDFLAPPDEVRLVYTDSLNRIKRDNFGLLSQMQTTYQDQTRNEFPISVGYDINERWYNAEVSGALQAIFSAEIDEEIVTIYPVNMDRRANRFVFKEDNVRLRLYITIPN